MIRVKDQLPPIKKDVLLFDVKLNKWRIGHLEERLNTKYWVFEHKLFAGLDQYQVSHWTELPEAPN